MRMLLRLSVYLDLSKAFEHVKHHILHKNRKLFFVWTESKVDRARTTLLKQTIRPNRQLSGQL